MWSALCLFGIQYPCHSIFCLSCCSAQTSLPLHNSSRCRRSDETSPPRTRRARSSAFLWSGRIAFCPSWPRRKRRERLPRTSRSVPHTQRRFLLDPRENVRVGSSGDRATHTVKPHLRIFRLFCELTPSASPHSDSATGISPGCVPYQGTVVQAHTPHTLHINKTYRCTHGLVHGPG